MGQKEIENGSGLSRKLGLDFMLFRVRGTEIHGGK
jgi:hypothetical protein